MLHLFVRLTNDHFGLVVIHQIEREIQRVGGNINDRTAALFLLVEEHAPVRRAASADGKAVRVIDLAKLARFDVLLCIGAFRLVTVLIADGQSLARCFCRVKHSLGVSGGLCHGLFAHHVLACIKRVDRDLRVLQIGRQNVNDLDLLVLQELTVILIHLRVGRAVLFLCLLRAL